MTCEEVLQDYLNNNEGWHKKVHLYAVAEDWDASTVDGELRLMQQEGKIKGDYYWGTYRKVKLKKYCANSYTEKKPQLKIITVNGIPTAVYG